MFHIIVNKNTIDEVRGKASNIGGLLTVLSREEIKSIFDHDAYAEIKDIFKRLKKIPGSDTFIEDINGITVNYISNGYEITTLVFYFPEK